jgi:hypothetical protein
MCLQKNTFAKIVGIAAPILTVILGIVFFCIYDDSKMISSVIIVIGSYLSINAIISSVEANKRNDILKDIGKNLESTIETHTKGLAENSQIMELYRKINDPDLVVFRENLFKELISNLEDLSKGTLHIEGDECYLWISKCLCSSNHCIHGVSALKNQEWTKDERELKLYLENVNAKKRGVDVYRIFIVSDKELINNYLYRVAILRHINDGLDVSIVYESSLTEDDILIKIAHHGFLLIDNEFGFIDDYFPGKTTGKIIKKKELCANYYKFYNTFHYLSKPANILISELYVLWKQKFETKYQNINILKENTLKNIIPERTNMINDYITWYEILYYEKNKKFFDYSTIKSSEILSSPDTVFGMLN